MDITHPELVSKLVKPGRQILAEMSHHDANLIHMVLGISGEAGELLDAIKKRAIYQKPLDFQNVVEELGDLEFYMEGIRQELGITRDLCLANNIAKLSKRYQQLVYSNESAIARNDKLT